MTGNQINGGKWLREPGRMYETCPCCGYAKKIFYGWLYCPMCGARLERDE